MPRHQILAIMLLLSSTPSHAQVQWASDLGVAASVGSQIVHASRDERPARALLLTGARLGAVSSATWLIKKFVRKGRPCAPADCGREQPYKSFPSGHTAQACSATGSYALVTWSLSGLVAADRVSRRKHDGWDVSAGCLLGAAAARWIR